METYKSVFNLFFFLLFLNAFPAIGQKKAKEIPELSYEQRIKKTRLNQKYIPKDLSDCFSTLNKLISESSKQKFKELPELEAVEKMRFGFGTWMMKNWSLYDGSRLSHYLRNLGVSFPDDMVDCLILSYHRYLNDTDLLLKEQVIQFKAIREEAHKEKLKNRRIIEEGIIRRPATPKQ